MISTIFESPIFSLVCSLAFLEAFSRAVRKQLVNRLNHRESSLLLLFYCCVFFYASGVIVRAKELKIVAETVAAAGVWILSFCVVVYNFPETLKGDDEGELAFRFRLWFLGVDVPFGAEEALARRSHPEDYEDEPSLSPRLTTSLLAGFMVTLGAIMTLVFNPFPLLVLPLGLALHGVVRAIGFLISKVSFRGLSNLSGHLHLIPALAYLCLALAVKGTIQIPMISSGADSKYGFWLSLLAVGETAAWLWHTREDDGESFMPPSYFASRIAVTLGISVALAALKHNIAALLALALVVIVIDSLKLARRDEDHEDTPEDLFWGILLLPVLATCALFVTSSFEETFHWAWCLVLLASVAVESIDLIKMFANGSPIIMGSTKHSEKIRIAELAFHLATVLFAPLPIKLLSIGLALMINSVTLYFTQPADTLTTDISLLGGKISIPNFPIGALLTVLMFSSTIGIILPEPIVSLGSPLVLQSAFLAPLLLIVTGFVVRSEFVVKEATAQVISIPSVVRDLCLFWAIAAADNSWILRKDFAALLFMQPLLIDRLYVFTNVVNISFKSLKSKKRILARLIFDVVVALFLVCIAQTYRSKVLVVAAIASSVSTLVLAKKFEAGLKVLWALIAALGLFGGMISARWAVLIAVWVYTGLMLTADVSTALSGLVSFAVLALSMAVKILDGKLGWAGISSLFSSAPPLFSSLFDVNFIRVPVEWVMAGLQSKILENACARFAVCAAEPGIALTAAACTAVFGVCTVLAVSDFWVPPEEVPFKAFAHGESTKQD